MAVVDWNVISKGNPDAWLYFYEDFLQVYDNSLRKKTGSVLHSCRGRSFDDPSCRRRYIRSSLSMLDSLIRTLRL